MKKYTIFITLLAACVIFLIAGGVLVEFAVNVALWVKILAYVIGVGFGIGALEVYSKMPDD